MRLICPNCGAQYAVADDVIPAGGRDVQCSNCAHTWFETPNASAADEAPEPRKTSRPTPPEAPSANEDEDHVAPAPQPSQDRRPVKPEVADILREEAARETAQRRSETPDPIESQSDLGLDEPTPEPTNTPRQTVHEKAAALSAAAAGATGGAAAAAGSRRELLPDIEEINSNLDQDETKQTTETSNSDLFAQTKTERKSRGFRRGFLLALLIVAFLVMIYVQADNIKSIMPALSGVLDSYIGVIDGMRIALNNLVYGSGDDAG